MAAASNVTAVIGPQQGGKTTLLASIKDCIEEKAFGYPRWVDPHLTPIPQAGQNRPRDRLSVLQRLSAVSGEYAEIQRTHIDQDNVGMATPLERTFEYHFSLNWTAESAEQESANLTIVDAAGELLTGARRVTDGIQAIVPPETKNKYLSTLLESDAIMLVLPLIPLDDADWVPEFQQIVDGLCDLAGNDAKLRHFTVVFSQYERLFTDFGPRALYCASLRPVMAHILREQLREIQWLNKLSDLERKTQPVTVRFTATSAWGFVRNHGNPNLDLNGPAGRPRRFAIESQGKTTRRSLWRPFLTADPFLFPIIGDPHPYMFSFEDLFGAPLAKPKVEPLPIQAPSAPPAGQKTNGAADRPQAAFQPDRPKVLSTIGRRIRDMLTE